MIITKKLGICVVFFVFRGKKHKKFVYFSCL